MPAILTRLRAEFRTRWRAWAAVAFLIALAGGVVLTTAAGARRTVSAYARFLRASHGADVLVSPDATGFPDYYAALERATGALVAPVIGYGVTPLGAPTQPILLTAGADGRFGATIEQPKVTAGRKPRPDRADEVLADTTAARVFHLHAGATLRVLVAGTDEELPRPGHDPEVTLHVVGIGVTRDSAVSVNALASVSGLLAGPAFAHRFGSKYHAFDGAYVALRPGTSKAAFAAKAQALTRRFPRTGGSIFVADEHDQAAIVEHAIRPQGVALALFAAFIALTALFALGQLLSRQLFLASADNHVLRSLGMSRPQLFVLGMAEVIVVATAGALLAMIVAIVASPVMPIGPARLAEPHPGLAFDWTVLAGGLVLIVAALGATAVWPAWRAATRAGDRDQAVSTARRSLRVTRWAAGAGAPPSATIGIGYAVDPGRGRTAVPARSAIAVTALAVTSIAAALTFGANLSHLVHTPRLYGQSWDITADAQFSSLASGRTTRLLSSEPGVSAWTFGLHDNLSVGGHDVPTIGLTRARGPLLAPTTVDGRTAEHPREIALGTRTLDRLHLRVGDEMRAELQNPSAPGSAAVRMRVVGRSVFPFFGEGSFTPTGLGVGAQVASAGASGNPPANFVLIRVAPGPDHDARVARVVRDLGRGICGTFNQCTVSTASRPTDVLNYSRVQSTPLALAIALALLASGILANVLVTSTRRRRHDLAILETLGFGRRQVAATIAWQATTLVALALVVGLPVGIAIGRWVWATFATNLGIPAATASPVGALLLTIPVALIIGNTVAAVPGVIATRIRPAAALRTE